jgi:hypothetical protein
MFAICFNCFTHTKLTSKVHNWLILTELQQLQKKISPKIVKKNKFIDCHQESDYTGDHL